METCRVDFGAAEWEEVAPAVRQKVSVQGGKRLRLVEFSGGFEEPDWCTRGHIGYVLAGQMELQFADRAVTFGPGDGIFIPPGEQHKHKGKVLTDVLRAVLVEDV